MNPTTIDQLPLGKRIIARLYTIPSCDEEAAARRQQGLPVEGMTEAEAVHFALTGKFERR